jgi:hypothetical protein
MLPMELQKEMPDASPNASSIDVHKSKPYFFRDEGMFDFIYLGLNFAHMLHPTTLILLPMAPNLFGGESCNPSKKVGLNILLPSFKRSGYDFELSSKQKIINE